MLGTVAEESRMRETTYMRYGCNMYNSNRPLSTPLAFWTEDDIWEYIHSHELTYSKIYDMGYDRTGCMFCLYGVHQGNKKFELMKNTHPQLYKYCMEVLGIGSVLDYMKESL